MPAEQQPKRLGFFTRLLDATSPAERYRLATQQIIHAERCGYDSAWIAQHHFHEDEGGLPSPFVFLSAVAARTVRIRLGTGIVTLPLELPVRVAEDSAVIDLMSGGRFELGVGPGGNPTAFPAFGLDSSQRHVLFNGHLDVLRQALAGSVLAGGDVIYPNNPPLVDRIWQATFSVEGARRAGAAGDGLMLSRTQPRSKEAPNASLSDIQDPMVDAYLEALPPGRAPRILASRSVYASDSRAEALRYATTGLRRMQERKGAVGPDASVEEMIAAFDVHIGTPDEVVESLHKDRIVARATDFTVQVHSVDPPHPLILRSIELVAQDVAPALGWAPQHAEVVRRVA